MTHSAVRRWRRSDSTHGVTLVELLVTIMIIGILSSSVLFAMSVAQESARKARTQALIATLHSLLIERWETYLTKRINVDGLHNLGTTTTNRRGVAALRLKTIRQFLVMDFPDQWCEVLDLVDVNGGDALHEDYKSALHMAIAEYRNLADPANLARNQGAECLYIILKSIRSSGSNWEKMNEDFIGDTDGDNLLEYLDGWGRPIEFIRWPAGFPSDLQSGQQSSELIQPPANRMITPEVEAAAATDHDPFDPFQIDEDAYRLVPLIFSAGPDGVYDMVVPDKENAELEYRWNPYYEFVYGYQVNGSDVTRYKRAGEPLDRNDDGIENWHDNIHNHLIYGR